MLFKYLDIFYTTYLNNILVYLDNKLKHNSYIKLVLEKLCAIGLQVNIKKYEFSITKTKYLGFIISTKGIKVDPKKVAIIKVQKPSYSIKGIQSFLGFCNFYQRFIQDFRVIAKLLTKLIVKDIVFNFTSECLRAFKELKSYIVNTLVLAYYDPKKASQIKTDTSNSIIARVFLQLGSNNEQYPVAFFSKTIAPIELNYKIYNKEILAIIQSLINQRAKL